jgi:hypothetical protein
MVIRTKGFATSTGGREDGELACAYCTDESGYCLSVARFPDDELVEVMVIDQVTHKTREVSVELSSNELRLRLSSAAAAKLDGITEYIVPLTATEKELQELDAALRIIFAGGNRGEYLRGCEGQRWPNEALTNRGV